LRNFSANIRNQFAALVLTSLDAKPIAQSSRLLLVAASRVTNNGSGPPTMIEPVTGEIFLCNVEGATSVYLTALDGSARTMGQLIPAGKMPDVWRCEIGEPATTWYLISIKR